MSTNTTSDVLQFDAHARAGVRIVVALILLQHGLQKMLSFPSPPPSGPVEPVSLFGLAGTIEIVAGVLLLVGFLSRLAAFILSGLMACAYFIVHAPKSPYPIDNGGDLVVLLCFVLLYLSIVGSGAWSVDRMVSDRAKRRSLRTVDRSIAS